MRKVDRRAERWYPTDSDAIRLGPYPQKLIENIKLHWALTYSQAENLPDTFNILNARHFTGAPVACTKVAEVFRKYCDQDIELIPISRFWSLSSKSECADRYEIVNLYSSALSIDLDKTDVVKVVNPKFGYPYGLAANQSRDIFVRRDAHTNRHVWRDKSTSTWLCDDTFREAITNVSPQTYEFREVSLI